MTFLRIESIELLTGNSLKALLLNGLVDFEGHQYTPSQFCQTAKQQIKKVLVPSGSIVGYAGSA
jgi:hypothetical protein